MGTRSVGHHHRHQERRNTALTLFEADLHLLLERSETADTGPENHSETRRIDTDVARLFERFRRGRDGKLLHPIGASSFLRVREVRVRIPILDGDPLTPGESRTVQAGPERLATNAARRDHAEAGDGDTASEHQPSFPTMRSKA